MLNTDQHSPQVKKRMDQLEFVRNNRGINDGANLPDELLHQIYDDIRNNEIRMKDEVEAEIIANANAPIPGLGIANALANVGRDLQKEAYVTQSNGMANKTEVGVHPSPLTSCFDEHYTGLIPDHGSNTATWIQ